MSQAEGGVSRRLPVGAEILGQSGVNFRVWAPDRRRVRVVLEGGPGVYGVFRVDLDRESGGYFSGTVDGIGEGTLYRFQLNDKEDFIPDPASRFQPEGPFGPSQIVNPNRFPWTDAKWPGVQIQGQIMYEMHIGTFTPEGVWESAKQQLEALAKTGITLLEVMPVADFPGQFGWGYDGVNLFAPTHLYGSPDDMRSFVDKAHALGLGVILDVVYNHVGNVGSFLRRFSRTYFSTGKNTDWGEAINYDEENSAQVREFFTSNAAYWIDEFHLDGLRLDATQNIYDTSSEHIVAAVTQQSRKAAKGRHIVVVAENEPQLARIVEPREKGGYGCDALWNDDFHHTAMVTLTGRREGYYTDYLGSPQELISSVKRGYLYQGQYYMWQEKRRGTPALNTEPAKFVHYLQNHDQVANSAYGLRYQHLTALGRYRAMTALLLLAPETPLLFQGQEFGASTPFLYFSDMPAPTADQVKEGRSEFLSQFRSQAQPEMRHLLPNPGDPETFHRCKLDPSERQKHVKHYMLFCDLIKIRREDPVFRSQRVGGVDGAILAPEAFLLRFFGEEGDDRLVIFNFGKDTELEPSPEPLLAPPQDRYWKLMWSSEDPAYGGTGTPPPEDEDGIWRVLGEAAVVLKAVKENSLVER